MLSRSARLVLLLCVALVGARALDFEIAAVKPADPGARNSNVTRGAGGSLTITNVPPRKIITYAYDLRDFQLAGGPAWIGDARYDIVARTSAEDRSASEATDETAEQRKERVARVLERLRSLLAERFGLRVHVEQRERTVLALSNREWRSKTDRSRRSNRKSEPRRGPYSGIRRAFSMLVTQLSAATGMTVVDETGVRGAYNFVLDWAQDEKKPERRSPVDLHRSR